MSVEKGVLKHIAIIMDGNRRWAKNKGLPEVMGHKKVVEENVEELIQRAAELVIPYITFWAFSTENWNRSTGEVNALMELFGWALDNKVKKFVEMGARLRIIGDITRFSPKIQSGFEKAIELSERNDVINVTFALNYGGKDEIMRAAHKWQNDNCGDNGNKDLGDYLDTAGMPDPDLIIRTGGEQRLSGFLPWQSVYSELYFPETLMPDFGAKELDKAIEEYGRRQRRFGK